MSRTRYLMFFLIATALLAAPAVHAVTVAPGQVLSISGSPLGPGTVIAEVLRPFSIDLGGGSFVTGSVQDRVTRLADDELAFEYRVFVDEDSAGAVSGFGRGDFEGYATDMDYESLGAGDVAPLYAARSNPGSTAGFYFFDAFTAGIGAGETSFFSYVRTNASAYNEGGTANIYNYNAATGQYTYGNIIPTFQPVPEPGTLALLMAGIGILVGVLRRRR